MPILALKKSDPMAAIEIKVSLSLLSSIFKEIDQFITQRSLPSEKFKSFSTRSGKKPLVEKR